MTLDPATSPRAAKPLYGTKETFDARRHEDTIRVVALPCIESSCTDSQARYGGKDESKARAQRGAGIPQAMVKESCHCVTRSAEPCDVTRHTRGISGTRHDDSWKL